MPPEANTGNPVPGTAKVAGKFLLLAASYFFAARLGLLLAPPQLAISLIWLPTGIAVAGLYRWGLKYWPAIRPILTTGRDPPYVSTTAIWSTVRRRARSEVAVLASKVSAQSPAVRTNASPRSTAASR